MKKLKRFNKSNKKNIMPLVALCAIVAVVSAAISYAVYQKEDEILFINARVGQFETSSSDIELAMTLDGEDIEVPPSKGNYNVTVECDHADGTWNMDEWGADIRNITSNRVKCNANFETLETLPLSIVEVGDYISMTPTSTSYTISKNMTGYSSDQTINPSELNLWRVIRKNEDGTVEIISENVSSTVVYFYGKTGYMNFVGSLNTIAAQYTNEKYIKNTRHMGYNNQIENCTTLSTTACPSDTEYETDLNLALVVFDSLDTSWLTSRNINTHSNGKSAYRCLGVSDTSAVIRGYLVSADGSQHDGGGYIHPILTLKSDVVIKSGDGQSAETAYQLR